ncbi:hypothetical protein [Pleomorphovibrio marinus]|uniref:hypothetical protein n=1 Tax=Pleomorphovibrio marinus TaxID=2164132 RepID=UPI000E0B00CD|nr:hypothetical protein [Pleomorphovibrio marinus]
MELKRIDNLWHFFATQNDLFLKKEVHQVVEYEFEHRKIRLTHSLNPKIPLHSHLVLSHRDFDLGVDRYTVSKKRFGLKSTPRQTFQQQFFPNELMKLTSAFNLYVERDRHKHIKVTLEPFVPKNIREIRNPVNLISKCLWRFSYFSELIKN